MHKITFKGKPYSVELEERLCHIKDQCHEYACRIFDASGNEFGGVVQTDGEHWIAEETLEFHTKPCKICGMEKIIGESCEACNDWKMD